MGRDGFNLRVRWKLYYGKDGAEGEVSDSWGGPHNFGTSMRPGCLLSQIHQGSDGEDTHRLINTPLLPTPLSGRDHTDFQEDLHRDTAWHWVKLMPVKTLTFTTPNVEHAASDVCRNQFCCCSQSGKSNPDLKLNWKEGDFSNSRTVAPALDVLIKNNVKIFYFSL